MTLIPSQQHFRAVTTIQPHPTMPNLNKRDLVVAITNRLGQHDITQQVVGDVMDSMLDIIVERLSSGDDVSLRNFGQFVLVESKERIGRNPKKPAETTVIPARSMVKFRPSTETKAEIAKALPYMRQRRRS